LLVSSSAPDKIFCSNAFRIAPWRLPSAIHVEDVEFVMFFC
jgi:hypothetical protein